MGRSVSTPVNCARVYYFPQVHLVGDEEDEKEVYFEDLVDNLREGVRYAMPDNSPTFVNKWLDREDHAVIRIDVSGGAEFDFGISEYCGIVALWLTKNEVEIFDEETEVYNSVELWPPQSAINTLDEWYSDGRKSVGTFSIGGANLRSGRQYVLFQGISVLATHQIENLTPRSTN